VGHVQAAVQRALEGGKGLGAGGGALQAGVQEAEEGAGAVLHGVDAKVLAIGLLLAGVVLRQPKLGEDAARQQQAHAVGGGVVLEAHAEAVLGQLVRVGGRHHHVAGDGGVDHLAGDVPVAEAHHQAVLVGVVLVLVLGAQPEARAVVGLALREGWVVGSWSERSGHWICRLLLLLLLLKLHPPCHPPSAVVRINTPLLFLLTRSHTDLITAEVRRGLYHLDVPHLVLFRGWPGPDEKGGGGGESRRMLPLLRCCCCCSSSCC